MSPQCLRSESVDRGVTLTGEPGRVYVGIDPGQTGAVVAINNALCVVGVWDTPLIALGKGKHDFDIPGMATILRLCLALCEPGGGLSVTLERAQAMRSPNGEKQGTVSSFATGRGYGIWEGVLAALKIRWGTARPCDWVRCLLRGMEGHGKARSVAFASMRFPDLELTPPRCRKPRDGRADAACLAFYGRRFLWGGEGG